MGRAVKCDRCGSITEREMPFLRLKAIGRPMYRDYPHKGFLCDDCEDDFAAFMEGAA